MLDEPTKLHYGQNFVEEYWDQKPLHSTNSHQLNAEQFLQLLQYQLSLPAFYAQYRPILRNTGPEIINAENLAQVVEHLNQGYSLFINRYESALSPEHPIAQMAIHLQKLCQRELDWIAVYITPPNTQAVPAHLDHNEVFNFQLLGEKHWQIANERIDPNNPPSSLPKFSNVTVKAGDSVFIPSHFYHKVVAAGSSYSVSVAIVLKTEAPAAVHADTPFAKLVLSS